MPHLSLPLTYSLTERELKVTLSHNMPIAPFPGRKWAGLAKLHPIPAAQEKVRGSGEGRVAQVLRLK